ncbi:gliding motility protein GldN [Muribaculum intestinale]|jgi:gliding motility associated protien GldN|uniref:type IX secretion system ring protein PorN/GldN n=1 Tax=Muribaculum intestinale TaxID=1796646 RepID=UPI00242B9475|nr:gliding motility protein GldN [Muribaculum intestinale]
MKPSNRHIHILLGSMAVALVAFDTMAQQPHSAQQQSTSSAIIRRAREDARNDARKNASGVTERMQQFYEEPARSDADAQWMKIVYRQVDLDKVKNAPLYYPEEIIDGQENLFRIIMRLVADGQLDGYEYLDGREIFNDQYRIKVRDMLDRFHIIYAEAKGSTEKNPRFAIEESDVPTNEVLSYYLLERWELDKRTNRMRTTVDAICPVLHRAGDFGGEAVKYPMFWLKMDKLRPYLAQQSIFIDDDNNLASYTYDDFFTLGLYEGDIYKTRNLRNLSMMQMYPDPDDLRHAQDSIQNYLTNYEKKMWVPSREELAIMAEERERIAAGDTIASRDEAVSSVPKSSSRRAVTSRRGQKSSSAPKSKTTKVKTSKPKVAKSSAKRSVRRRK